MNYIDSMHANLVPEKFGLMNENDPKDFYLFRMAYQERLIPIKNSKYV